MKITVAKTAGFCMGVRRAVDMVLDEANKTHGPICTFGPLIHNPQVLEMLKGKGIPSITSIPDKGEGTVLIRAHGIPPQEEKALAQAGFNVINATCPRVIRVQTIIRKHADRGYRTIIIGDGDHPEVKGLLGYARDMGVTASTMDDLKALPDFDRAVIVAQTTQDTSFFARVKEWAKALHPNYKIFDTICDSTEKRQNETRTIARASDAVVVVGGKASGNTRRLAQVARETGKPVMHIEEIGELDFSTISSAEAIAVTAGASTPSWIICQARQTIEDHLAKKKKAFPSILFPIRDFLLWSNLLLSLGAGSLTYACTHLQGTGQSLVHAATAMLYILSMQIINNLFTITSDRYNNPGRAKFYEKNRIVLSLTAIICGGAGLFLSWTCNLSSFFLLAVMSILGLSYNRKIFFFLKGTFRDKRIKDIPGSKSVLIALAWGTVTTLLPALAAGARQALVPGFIFATGLVFARTAFFDVLEIQGDRITGKETLPILIGEKRSMALIKGVLVFIILVLLTAAMVGMIDARGVFLAGAPLFMFYLVTQNEKGGVQPGTGLTFMVETVFILAGAIALIVT